MARTASAYIASAQTAFEAGFKSMAAKKRAMDELNRAYSATRDDLLNAILRARTPETEKQNHDDYWGVPSELHNVRDRHFDIATRYCGGFEIVHDLIALRLAIKEADIAPPPAKPEIEQKAEAVRRTILEEMERRKAAYVEGLDVSRIWNELFPRMDGKISLPVTVNAHIVYGHKGAVFPRHFFYLRGKLTPLNTIIAIAQKLESEVAD